MHVIQFLIPFCAGQWPGLLSPHRYESFSSISNGLCPELLNLLLWHLIPSVYASWESPVLLFRAWLCIFVVLHLIQHFYEFGELLKAVFFGLVILSILLTRGCQHLLSKALIWFFFTPLSKLLTLCYIQTKIQTAWHWRSPKPVIVRPSPSFFKFVSCHISQIFQWFQSMIPIYPLPSFFKIFN